MPRAKDEGGNAFPNCHVPPVSEPEEPIQLGSGWTGSSGMTLRDYFAAKAMQAIVSNPDCQNVQRHCTTERSHEVMGTETIQLPETIADAIASNAYFMADAMLKAREVSDAKE